MSNSLKTSDLFLEKHYLFIKHKTLFTDNKFVDFEIEAEKISLCLKITFFL